MDTEVSKNQGEQTDENPMATLANEKSFEEHKKDARIEAILSEMENEDAEIMLGDNEDRIFAHSFSNRAHNADGKLVEKREGEKFAIWATAKEIAKGYDETDSLSEKQDLKLKMSILKELWGGESLDAQMMNTAELLAKEADELLERKDSERINGFVRRLSFISKINSDMAPHRQEYIQYRQEKE